VVWVTVHEVALGRPAPSDLAVSGGNPDQTLLRCSLSVGSECISIAKPYRYGSRGVSGARRRFDRGYGTQRTNVQ